MIGHLDQQHPDTGVRVLHRLPPVGAVNDPGGRQGVHSGLIIFQEPILFPKFLNNSVTVASFCATKLKWELEL
nr:MAG TPA: hypothetical protein [Caudoviricetes sp.]